MRRRKSVRKLFDFRKSAAFLGDVTTSITASLQQTIKAEVAKALANSKEELTALSAEACSSSFDDLTSHAAKKVKLMAPNLKKVGNIKRYEHNQKVLEEIEAAERQLDKGNIALAKEKLQRGKKLILLN